MYVIKVTVSVFLKEKGLSSCPGLVPLLGQLSIKASWKTVPTIFCSISVAVRLLRIVVTQLYVVDRAWACTHGAKEQTCLLSRNNNIRIGDIIRLMFGSCIFKTKNQDS